jgi:hypothetical protein
MSLTVVDQNAFFGVKVPLSSFPDLLETFLGKDPDTLEIEKLGASLIADDFPEPQTKEFVTSVSKWGGYAGVGGRVLKRNAITDICFAFRKAASILANTKSVVDALDRKSVEDALDQVNKLHGLGTPSFASKHLRFLRPDLCGVLDSFLYEKLPYSFDKAGYSEFCGDCSSLANQLAMQGISAPPGRSSGWLVADVEMALYEFVVELRNRESSRRADAAFSVAN